MEYRIKKNQIFKKALPVPLHIKLDVYGCKLSFNDYIAFNLEDKVPISCLEESDRMIVQRFGIEKAKELDWALLEFAERDIRDAKEILLRISKDVDDINDALYKALNLKIAPVNYSKEMKEKYPNREVEISPNDNGELKIHKEAFNAGRLDLIYILRYWRYFKDKDLTVVLANDKNNTYKITDRELKEFMAEFKNNVFLIAQDRNIYELIRTLNDIKDEDEKVELLKEVCQTVLDKTKKNRYEKEELDDEQYRELFKYIPMLEYFSSFEDYKNYMEDIFKYLEYDGLTQDYFFTSGIPIEILKNRDILFFIKIFGFKNIVEFDKECGNFFTKDDYRMLKNMYEYYLHYGGNDHDPRTSIYVKKTEYDSEGRYIDRPYTKDEFYESMKRMIVGGPTNHDYIEQAPDYRQMTGEFKVRNSSLFLDSNAPEELKKYFYTKSLKPSIIRDNPHFIPFLEGKDLKACFENYSASIILEETGYHDYVNLYDFLLEKTDFNHAMEIIKEYSDVLELIRDRKVVFSYNFDLEFNEKDDIETIINKTNHLLRRIIIELGMPYPKNIPSELYKSHPEMFLSNDAPVELQKLFYTRTLTPEMIIENEEYKEHLKGKDLQLIYKYMPIAIRKKTFSYYDNRVRVVNLPLLIQEEFEEEAFDIMFSYGKYLEMIYEKNRLEDFSLNVGYTKEDIFTKLDETVYSAIVKHGITYDDKLPDSFKEKNPTLFLKDNVPQEIKDKFYSRKLTIEDFNDNKDLIDIIGDTNIICGFDPSLVWLIPILNTNNPKIDNLNRLKVLTEYYKIQDASLKQIFKEYVEKYKDNINMDTISNISEVLIRLSMSNSKEMYNFRKELAFQILNTKDPIDSLNKVERIFIKNNIPTVGKAYSCFEILHPDFQGFNMDSGTISPVLKNATNKKRKYIVFNDLIKSAFGSNNRSINKYLDNLENGYKLYSYVKENNISFEDLTLEEQETLKTFRRIISTLYDRTFKGKLNEDTPVLTADVIHDLQVLEEKLSEYGSTDYNLADRVVKMFCGGAKINTVEEARRYVYEKVSKAEKRNIERSKTDMTLVQGDLVKGINDIKYLRNILQNGSVSKEFLGSYAGSDATPLDTDMSMVLSETGSVRDKIEGTAAKSYGPIWIVLKNDERFSYTRNRGETLSSDYDPDRLELFYTGAVGGDHHGIRTGFASSEIDYLVTEKYDTRVGLEIAMNGFYIPVADKDGKIVFTYEDYKRIREQMAGLSYFNEENYVFSENLVTAEVEEIASQTEESNKVTDYKREKIYKVVKEALQELNLTLKTSIDGDLTENFVELIDTGSTGRGTNKPGDGDFDFMMRLDRGIISDSTKLRKLKDKILEKLGVDKSKAEISTGDFRIKDVVIDDITVDIDISFTTKTDSVTYSTDMALQDRLETIKKQDPKKYDYVVANILLAKQVLKAGNVYKPNRGEVPQGGLGGVGVENWILQHGGSFYDAAKTFVAAAEGKSFEEFLHTYEVWDFGENHMADKNGKYIHDEFIANNMSREGYIKMIDVLKKYLKSKEVEMLSTANVK